MCIAPAGKPKKGDVATPLIIGHRGFPVSYPENTMPSFKGAIEAGADGIEMGTAFMATQECPIHPNCKQAIVDAIDRDIVACGQSTGEPSWQITNPLAQEMLKIEADLPWDEAKTKIQEMSMGSLRAAAMEGDREKGAVLAGQVVGLIHDIPPVADRIVKFCNEWEELLKKDYSLF